MKLNAIEKLMLNNPVRHLAQRFFEAPRIAAMTGRLDGKRALEIGCGRGFGVGIILKQFGVASVRGIDIDPRSISRAQKRIQRYKYDSRAEALVGDVTAIPAEDASFDVVFDFNVLYHVENWEDGLREIARVLKPGGLFVFREASKKTLDRWTYRMLFNHPRENRFTMDGFVASLERHGIVVGDDLKGLWFDDFFVGAGRRTRRIRLRDDEALAKIAGLVTARPR